MGEFKSAALEDVKDPFRKQNIREESDSKGGCYMILMSGFLCIIFKMKYTILTEMGLLRTSQIESGLGLWVMT